MAGDGREGVAEVDSCPLKSSVLLWLSSMDHCWGEGPLLLPDVCQGGCITFPPAQLRKARIFKPDLTQGLGMAGGMRCIRHHCFWLTVWLIAPRQGAYLPLGISIGLSLPDLPS